MSLPKGAVNKALSKNILKTPFIMFQSHKDDYENMSHDLGDVHDSVLSKLFFNPNNIDIIQKKIITEIFRRSNAEYLIEKQNELDLQIVMRSIFIQHAKHLPYNIKEQIKELNDLVVDEVIPGIFSEIKAYFGYLESVFGERKIMDLPESTSIAGLKTLPSVSRSLNC